MTTTPLERTLLKFVIKQMLFPSPHFLLLTTTLPNLLLPSLIIAFNSLFYAMNDSSVDEHALFQRVLSALKPAGGRFITDRTTSALVSHAVFDDVVISKLGKGVNATSVFTRK